MSLASAAAVGPNMAKRPISVMGDGGFWHNGLITGVASNMFNKGDGVLIVMQNGYASATGQQYLPSSNANRQRHADRHQHRENGALARSHVAAHGAHLQRVEDGRDAEGSDAHCRARAESHHCRWRMHAGAPAPMRAENAEKLKRGERVVKTRFGVDDEICTGDHSCIRLSGCPSLTVKAKSRSAAHRPGRDRDRKLCRLRAVRRGRARGGAVPVVLSHRRYQQSELVGSRAASRAERRDRVACGAAA